MNLRRWLLPATLGVTIGCALTAIAQLATSPVLLNLGSSLLPLVLPSLLGLTGLMVLRAGPQVGRSFVSWLGSRLGPADIAFASSAGPLLTATVWAWRGAPNSGPLWAVACDALGIAALGFPATHVAMVLKRLVAPARKTIGEDRLADPLLIALGPSGSGPLKDFASEDLLDRGGIVARLKEAVRNTTVSSLVIGIEGSWGSGKTSILDAVAGSLAPDDFIVVRFDAWTFREPDRVVENFLSQLVAGLRAAGVPASVAATLRRLARGLAPLGGGRLKESIQEWLSPKDSATRDTFADLQETLQNTKRVVVVVDDLDRLSSAELHAALRLLRLSSQLPNTVHLLAYDSGNIAWLLFPHDDSGNVARDYVGKLVTLELSLCTPTPEAQYRLLGTVLDPWLKTLEKDDSDTLVTTLRRIPAHVLVAALPTPREVRRVVAVTAFLWQQLKRDVNLADLFLLQILHVRQPQLYRTLHAHPEWFTHMKWADTLWVINFEEQWKKDSVAFRDRLWKSGSLEDVIAARLLSYIFPSMAEGPPYVAQNEAQARRERRIFHPQHFPRYFQLSVPVDQVAESSIEDIAEGLRQASSGHEREGQMRAALLSAQKREALRAFLAQWDIFLERVQGTPPQGISKELALDICLPMARLTGELPHEDPDAIVDSLKRTVGFRMLNVAELVRGNADATETIQRTIESCSSLGVGGLIVFYTCMAEDGRRALPQHSLNTNAIRGTFDGVVRSRLTADGADLFALEDFDLAEVIYRVHDIPLVRDKVVFRALHAKPTQLPRILRQALVLDSGLPSDREPMVLHNGLPSLHERLGLENLDNITKHLQLDYWEDPKERALVKYFRDHWKAVVAAAEAAEKAGRQVDAEAPGGDAASLPSPEAQSQ